METTLRDLAAVVQECRTMFAGKQGLVPLISQLLDALRKFRDNSDPNNQQRLTTAAQTVQNRMRQVVFEVWSPERKRVFTELKAGTVLGSGAADEIDVLMKEVGPRIGYVENRLVRLQEDASNLHSRLEQTYAAIQNLSHGTPTEAKGGRLTVIFDGRVEPTDLDELVDKLSVWKRILLGVGRLISNGTSAAKLLGLSNGSVILELAVEHTMADALVLTAKRILEILRQAEEFKAIRLKTRQLGPALSATVEEQLLVAETKLRDGINRDVSAVLVEQLARAPDRVEAPSNEDILAAENSVAELADFLDKGGRLAIQGIEAKETVDLQSLQHKLAEARIETSNFDLLEYKPSNTEEGTTES